jgi:hypothetical protein
MAKTIKIELVDAIQWHGQPLAAIELKEPTGAQYADLGEPRLIVRLADGGGYWIEQPTVIRAYLERCIAHEGGADLLSLMSLADAMRVKEQLIGFFTSAAAKQPPSKSIN